MKFYLTLASNWIVLLLIYTSSRVAFLFFNLPNYKNFALWDFIEGIRFDLSALAYINALYFLLFSIFSYYDNKTSFQLVKRYLFIITNSSFLILNNVDIVYFKFNLRRSSNEIFQLVQNSQDILSLIPQFIYYYWPITLLTIFQIWILCRTSCNSSINQPKNIIFYGVRIVAIIGLSILCARGGFQLKPIKPINAGEIFQSPNNQLILNTPFYFIHTFQKSELKQINEFSNSEIKSIFNPAKQYKEKNPRNLNIVIIIVESLSKEFVGYYNNGEGYTPFLDDLMKNSLVFENAFSNGLRSIDAVPAIISSIPSLMNDPFINSKYANNNVPSLSSLLRKEGYQTYFFHGGRRGTMGFLGYCNQTMFTHYIGMEDFPEKKFFDGDWGIYDEPFLKFSASEIARSEQPFFATIFTLSSHPPYNLPDKYSNSFPKGKGKIHELIGYTDHSLKMFFDEIRSRKCFTETVFVITADHTSSESFDSRFEGYLNRHKIPMIIYMGDNSLKGNRVNITQHIDIMPTVLDFIGYNKPFFSFGKSALKNESWALLGNDHEKFLITEDGILKKKLNETQSYKDFDLKEKTKLKSIHLKKLIALEQTFNNQMLNNNFEVNKHSMNSSKK